MSYYYSNLRVTIVIELTEFNYTVCEILNFSKDLLLLSNMKHWKFLKIKDVTNSQFLLLNSIRVIIYFTKILLNNLYHEIRIQVELWFIFISQ